LTVAPRECVAVVVATQGFLRPVRLRLVRADGTLLAHQDARGVVGQVQWCDVAGGALRVDVALESFDPDERAAYREGTLLARVLRGPWARVGGPAQLHRGELAAEAVATMLRVGVARGAQLAPDLQPPGTRPLLDPPLDVPSRAARVVPFDAAVYRTLALAVGHYESREARPRVDFAGQPAADATSLAFATEPPVVDVGFNSFQRVLAVVDPAKLGRDCVTVVFVRDVLDAPPRIYRVPPDNLAAAAMLTAQENAASDQRCGTAALYTVPDNDDSVYRLQVYGADASADAGAGDGGAVP
jgi:hypothetical protein